MTHAKKITLIVICVALFVVAINALAVGYWAWQSYRAAGPLVENKIVLIPKGIGVQQIAAQLRDEGVIAQPLLFKAGVFWERKERALKPGEYEFATGQSMQDVILQIAAGKTLIRRVTFPEGLTSAEIVAKLKSIPQLTGEIAMTPAEGELLPETYAYHHGDDRQAIIARMKAAMREAIATNWPKRQDGLPIQNEQQLITLASIVEKETSLDRERARVAAVYINRLRIGMPLQADPTAAYAKGLMGKSADEPLTYADLAAPHAYNTYQNPGLPPGPICNPGMESIRAVLQPLATNELYFVADGTGGHVFASTLEQHNKNVAAWRKVQRQAK